MDFDKKKIVSKININPREVFCENPAVERLRKVRKAGKINALILATQ